jgi:hypothetical protein
MREKSDANPRLLMLLAIPIAYPVWAGMDPLTSVFGKCDERRTSRWDTTA